MTAVLLLLLAAAASGADPAGAAAVESCHGQEMPGDPEGLPRYDSSFCETARRLSAEDPAGGMPEYADVWAAHAEAEARRYLEYWEFYHRHADTGTLEIVPSASEPGQIPPNASVTIRFDHDGPGTGRFDYRFGFDRYSMSTSVPLVIDGRPAYGSEASCLRGFYYDTDSGACRPFPYCPPGTTPYDGVCYTERACREEHMGRYFDGEWWSCPPAEIRDSLAKPPPAWEVGGETAAELVGSCAGFRDLHARGGTVPDPGSVFCRMVAERNIATSDAWRITSEIDWEEYATRAAEHFVDGWMLYQQVADKETLEITASASAAGGGAPVPEMSATVRLDYPPHHYGHAGGIWPVDGGTFEHTFAVGVPRFGAELPVVIDGRPAPGADLRCPDGYFFEWDDATCMKYNPCPDGVTANGMCDTSNYCDFFMHGSWVACAGSPAEEERMRFDEEVAGPLAASIALAAAAAAGGMSILVHLRRRGRRRAGRSEAGQWSGLAPD